MKLVSKKLNKLMRQVVVAGKAPLVAGKHKGTLIETGTAHNIEYPSVE